MQKYICKTCWRQFNEDQMVKNVSGNITDMCRTCNSIIGKGDGYSSVMTNEEADKWFDGWDIRKKEYENLIKGDD